MEREYPTLEEVRIGALQFSILEKIYNQTKEKLKNTKLEELTEEEIYILYLSEKRDLTDLENPEIQQLLIKHRFIGSLLNEIDYISNKQVIKYLLSSKEFVESNFIIKPVTITNIQLEKVDETLIDYFITSHFIDKETHKAYLIEATLPLNPSNAERYKNEIMSNKDNMLVILDSKKDKPMTLVKYYEDIDYNKTK